MLHKLAEDISFYLITNKVIDIEDRDIYIYGLELLISTLFTSISILILGFLIRDWISAVAYLSVYFFLKSYTGGYHAKHYYECYIYSIFVFIVLIIAKNIIVPIYRPIIGLFSLIFSIIVVFKFAPVTNKNNPKTEEEILKNKKIARRRILILSIMVILGYTVKSKLIDLWLMLALTEFSIAYSILKAKFLDKST
ncbi:accessory gene regulator ArgB-like protein [Tepidimicrobium xylanilyticum]|uniref:Accessory gene regulator B n=1 Tax=Tepidimicrobium xylanilyticum TaxID=1123352 RepID=A0A1H3DJ34_9FIRM|nr:accessory gene regulator B family protein [Tepidimicrobium xylanilyticum]GMG97338.1 accessory gene regulator [Tepidimicrobium xylanilyticum]SDX66401.1 accessory gene regulator B [Tepidimicrobium xylanilyticum]